MTSHLPQVQQVITHTDSIQLQLLMPQELIFFTGHFPGNPILPGIAQLDLAIEYVQQYLHIAKSQIDSVNQIKFSQIIRPGTTVILSLTLKDHYVNFQYGLADTVYSSGKIKLKR